MSERFQKGTWGSSLLPLEPQVYNLDFLQPTWGDCHNKGISQPPHHQTVYYIISVKHSCLTVSTRNNSRKQHLPPSSPQTYTYIHTHIHTYIPTHLHTHRHRYTHRHTHIHTYIHTHIYIHIYTHIYKHTCIHTYWHIHTHTHTPSFNGW